MTVKARALPTLDTVLSGRSASRSNRTWRLCRAVVMRCAVTFLMRGGGPALFHRAVADLGYIAITGWLRARVRSCHVRMLIARNLIEHLRRGRDDLALPK